MSEEEFQKELENQKIYLTEIQKNQLRELTKMLQEENQKINLTRIINTEDIYLKHYYDCASLCKIHNFFESETLCDIGSGAGFPGLVLKILFPHLKITLVDCVRKKVDYMNQTIQKLQLQNIKAIHKRAEDLYDEYYETFDIVTSRAVASLPKLTCLCFPFVKVGGFFLIMKGNCKEEKEECKKLWKESKAKECQEEIFFLPKEGSTRTLIKLEKISSISVKQWKTFTKLLSKKLSEKKD